MMDGDERDVDIKLDIANPTKLDVFQGMKIRDVACGENHTIAIMNSGE